jgi:hypothetical protein
MNNSFGNLVTPSGIQENDRLNDDQEMEWLERDLPEKNKKLKKKLIKELKQQQPQVESKPKYISLKEWLQDPKKKWAIIYGFQLLMAILAGLMTIIIFYAFNPPESQNSSGKQNSNTVWLASGIVFVGTFIIPEFFRWIKY